MVPTLLEKDRVVVTKVGWGPVPERWRVHTFEKHGVVYVKRCVGLPKDRLALVHGDVWVNGSVLVKPDDVREALRLPYERWEFGDVTPPGWARVDADGGVRWRLGWHLPAHARATPRAPDGKAFGLRDVYVDLDVERPASGWVRLELARTEELPDAEPLGGAWTLVVAPDGVRLEGVEGARWKAPAPPPGPTRCSLSTVDGVLRARVGEAAVEVILPTPDAPARVAFVVGDGARPRVLSLDRDLHYSNDHSLAVPAGFGNPKPEKPEDYATRVPDGFVFFLGDNTTNSTDSRNLGMGPIPVKDVIGPVQFRVWPPSRIGRVR
jgi:signal peptidase I